MATNKQTAGAFAVLGIFGAILFLTSCHNAPQEPTSDFMIEEQNYTSYEEKPLTSENTQKIEPVLEIIPQAEEKRLHYEYTDADVDMLARLVLKEAGGCSEEEQRLVVWTVFQRVDSIDYDFRNMNTIAEVVTEPHQFAYDDSAPIKDDIRRMCEEELEKWATGGAPPTVEPYAPSLPYLFFEGDGYHNWFRAEW